MRVKNFGPFHLKQQSVPLLAELFIVGYFAMDGYFHGSSKNYALIGAMNLLRAER